MEIEETAEVMHSLHQQGKIRAIGVSNFSILQMERFRPVAPLHVLQPPYNLFERGVEKDVLPYCHSQSISTLTYGSLCRGLLSGKMKLNSQFRGDDVRKLDPKFWNSMRDLAIPKRKSISPGWKTTCWNCWRPAWMARLIA